MLADLQHMNNVNATNEMETGTDIIQGYEITGSATYTSRQPRPWEIKTCESGGSISTMYNDNAGFTMTL